MKIFRAIAAIAFFAAMISQVAAQQPRPGQTPTGPTTSAVIPDSKIALIDSGAIADENSKALDAYAKAHGITLVLDVAKFQGIVSASDSLDITKAFIIEFNAKNPATAALNPK